MSTLIRRGWLALLVLAGLAAPTLRAEAPKKAGQPHVVLIGIGEYADKAIKPRPHAESDVKALYDLLTDKDRLGVDPKNVRLLLGKKDDKRGGEEATRENILKAIKWVCSSAKRDDLVIFAYVGQGASLGERGDRTCYFASDSTLRGRDKDALAAADVAQEFDKLRSQKVTVLLDVNFKGFDAGKESIPEATLGDVPYKEFLGDDEGEDHTPLPGRVIFMATNGLVGSPELDGGGLLARAVLDGLEGGADKEGYEADGIVTVDELTTFLNKHIPELKRKHNKIDKDRRNEHFIVGGRSSHFPLVYNPKPYAKSRERLAKLDGAAAKLGAEQAAEARRVLERMPRLKALQGLRKEYQSFIDGGQTLAQLGEQRTAILASMRLPAKDARNFATKVMEVVAMLDEDYVKEINKGEIVAWAIRGLYRLADERIPEDLEARLDGAKALTAAELGMLLADARTRLGAREDLDKHKDIDVALQRALIRLDPYTTYVDPETVARFQTEYKGRFPGIGVQIRKDAATDALQVVTPIKGSPAYKAGLMAGDLILTVIREVASDGAPLDRPEVIHTKDVTLNEAVKKIQGKPGTNVKLIIKREGKSEPFEVELTRARVEMESVYGVKREKDDSWDFWLDAESKIGYVRLGNFAENTYADMARAVRTMKLRGMKGLVLDLRFNPGGLLKCSQQVSDLFIDEGTIVSIRKPRRNQEERLTGISFGSLLDFEMAVLVNGQSASASEIVSACLQDHRRAVVVGERSYGKGSVQNIQEFDGGEVKLTIASFWRPSGRNLNKPPNAKDADEWGVTPDKGYLVELSRKEREDLAEHLRNSEIIPRRDLPAKEPKPEFKDRQLEAALKYLKEKQAAKK